MDNKKYILMIDDSNISLRQAKEILSGEYRLATCTSGLQGLEFLKKGVNVPNLILLDVNMPDIDGYGVMTSIMEDSNLCKIPVIFLTGDNDIINEAKGLRMGAMDLIRKPFVPEIMLSRINRVIEVVELRNKLEGQVRNKTKELEELSVYTDEIKQQARTDGLTGIYNRSYIEDCIKDKLMSSVSGALFMIDIDNFKKVNDSFGHIAGDEVLKKFAVTISDKLGDKGVIGRIGGDEFIAYYDGCSEREEVEEIAGSIIKEIHEHKFFFNEGFRVSSSIGIAMVPEDGISFMELYNKADKALYYVKHNGKNHYHFYSDENEAEDSEMCVQADIDAIKHIIGQRDSDGAYLVEYDGFKKIYQFLERVLERTQDKSRLMLFTITDCDGNVPDTQVLEQAMTTMEGIISRHLRRGDVATTFSSCQFIVILTGIDEDSSTPVARRILDRFREEFENEDINVQYVSKEICE